MVFLGGGRRGSLLLSLPACRRGFFLFDKSTVVLYSLHHGNQAITQREDHDEGACQHTWHLSGRCGKAAPSSWPWRVSVRHVVVIA